MIIQSRPDAVALSSIEVSSQASPSQEHRIDSTQKAEKENKESSGYSNTDGDSVEISKEARERQLEERQIRELQQRDREVRNHEQAHVVASGRIPVSGPIYTYEKGPDGRMYAVGGEVNFRMPPAQSPQEKIDLAQQLRRMALAPAQPSTKDRMVAAQAAQKISQARMELIKETQEEVEELRDTPTTEQSTYSAISGQLDN